MSNFDQRNQRVDSQVNAGVIGVLQSYPIEKVLFAEIIAAIVLQISINCCGVFSIYSPMLLFLYAPLCFCSPLTFGLNAVYVFVMGFLKKDSRLIILGAISIFLAVAPLMLYFVYRILHG